MQTERDGHSAIALQRIADPAVLYPLLGRFSEFYPDTKRPAIVSQWSMNYLSILLPAAVVSVLVLRSAIAFWDVEAELLHDEAQPVALKIARCRPALLPARRSEYWTRLIHEHLEPLIATQAEWGGLAPKVLWGNVVAVWDGAFARLDSALAREGFAETYQWLDQVTVAAGRLKLRSLQRMVESPAPDVIACLPLRRHCCLHYQLHAPVEGKTAVLCESCPRLHRLPPTEQASYLRYIYQGSG